MSSTPNRNSPEVYLGRLLADRWRIDELLALGGSSAVYGGLHVRNRLRVAIKMLHDEAARDHVQRQRLLRESSIANLIDHPCLVRIYDDGVTDDGRGYLVMERVHGVSLNRFVRDGGVLAIGEVLDMADALLAVLGLAHAYGVLHRDIKPANVMRTADGRVRLLDFGIAAMRLAQSQEELTEDGLVMGTVGYMAPEQARGEFSQLDARADLWSIGALMFALLSGTTVHDQGSIASRLVAHACEPARSLRDVAPTMPTALVELVDRALAFSVDDRWQSAGEFREALARTRAQVLRGPGVEDEETMELKLPDRARLQLVAEPEQEVEELEELGEYGEYGEHEGPVELVDLFEFVDDGSVTLRRALPVHGEAQRT